MKPMISRRTLNELREYFVATTLRVIDDEFTAAGVEPDTEYEPPVSGMRRTLVEQYYRTLDLTRWDDVRKVLDIFESILNQLRHDAKHESYEPSRKSAIATFDSLVGWLERDGYLYELHADPRFVELLGAVEQPWPEGGPANEGE